MLRIYGQGLHFCPGAGPAAGEKDPNRVLAHGIQGLIIDVRCGTNAYVDPSGRRLKSGFKRLDYATLPEVL